MALNYPGPYEVRMFYNVYNGATTEPHEQRLNVNVNGTPNPGDAMNTIQFVDRGSSLVQADTTIIAWANLIAPRWLVHANNVITHAELWRYAPLSFDATFISTLSINIAATGAGSTLIAGQEMYTFRTSEGGIMKLNFMESTQAQGAPQSYNALNAGQKAIVDFVLSVPDALWIARDTSFPVAFLRMFPGSNEALFKKRFRPS